MDWQFLVTAVAFGIGVIVARRRSLLATAAVFLSFSAYEVAAHL